MITIKEFFKYENANAIEVTWVETKQEIFIKKEILDDEEVEIVDTKTVETILLCQSFADSQIDLLRQTAKDFETTFTKEQEALIKEVELNRVPLSQEEIKIILFENEKQRVLLIKQEAGRIIESKYSIFKQLNITNLLDGYTSEDKTKMIDFINKIRAISNKAESEGTALENINWSI